MLIRKRFFFATMLAIALGGVAQSAFAQILKSEPPMGRLREGQVVLIDDGTCPKGQIKQVTGGNHVKAGGNKQIERSRRCIPR